jgi:hypothetical protein
MEYEFIFCLSFILALPSSKEVTYKAWIGAKRWCAEILASQM